MPDSVLTVNLMYSIINIINLTVMEIPVDDPSKLALVELRPRSEDFADMVLSCSIRHTGLEKDNWNDVEIASPGRAYNLYTGAPYIDNGGNQFFNLRFTVDFVLFFQELAGKVTREQATYAVELILARIRYAIQVEGWAGRTGAFKSSYAYDSFLSRIINANRAVKRLHVSPRGSEEETFFKARMFLQFEAEYEVPSD